MPSKRLLSSQCCKTKLETQTSLFLQTSKRERYHTVDFDKSSLKTHLNFNWTAQWAQLKAYYHKLPFPRSEQSRGFHTALTGSQGWASSRMPPKKAKLFCGGVWLPDFRSDVVQIHMWLCMPVYSPAEWEVVSSKIHIYIASNTISKLL